MSVNLAQDFSFGHLLGLNQTNTTKATSQSTSTDGDAVSCSLENPESCDSCQ